MKNNTLFKIECDSGIYTKNMKHLQYVPTRLDKISSEICFNTDKYEELKKEIVEKDLPKDIKNFLLLAATRHIVFNYQNVAEFYCQQDKEVQELMEKSGLVIIDFDDAMENGYVELTENLKELKYEAENLTK